jgi:hypothetical protein
MKRINFKQIAALAMFALIAISAQAQKFGNFKSAPHSASVYTLYGKEVYMKVWHDGKNYRADNVPGTKWEGLTTDKQTRTIYRSDSAKVYIIYPDDKQIMTVLPERMNTNSMLGLNFETGSNQTKEFIGMEEVDGKQCQHWSVTTKSTMELFGKTSEETSCYDYWFYEPWQMDIQTKSGCGFIEPLITLNVQFGPQPASLFEIPKGYQMRELIPAGGLMELITGKGRDENQQNVDAAGEKIKEGMDDISKQMEDYEKRTEGKSEAEKIQEALKMLGGSTKKK